MKPVLLTDFGSTYTKVTAVDTEGAELLGTASSYTTVETDINEGHGRALALLEERTGALDFQAQYACSSAAGGLKMVACGLTPELTAKAAGFACLGAGAKVVKTYAFELTDEDIEEINAIRPDILLLAGGIDGGNQACILHNAGMLAGCAVQFPILLVGNRSCARGCERLLVGREVYRCENVMPGIGRLNIEPVQGQIRALFLKRIIQAKGLSRAEQLISGILMPTPAAVLAGLTLLAEGTKRQPGLGDLMAVDLGGATTDVYSIASGEPQSDNTILKGMPEPYAKRTVEGDIGMRYSAAGILQAVGAERLRQLSGLSAERVKVLIGQISETPGMLPETQELAALDFALAALAVKTAVLRHAGTVEEVYTPMGATWVQTGKDLRGVKQLLVTGGALAFSKRAEEIAAFALADAGDPGSLRPRKAQIRVDRQYILAAMGLLGAYHPDCALHIMKKAFT